MNERTGNPALERRGARRRRWWPWLLLLVLIAGGWGLYSHYTSDEQIRLLAERTLSGLSTGDVRVESASFSLFGPIHLDGVGLSCNLETNRCEGENSCLTDRDCLPGTICNPQTQQCTSAPPDCLANADCPDGTVCHPPTGQCVPSVTPPIDVLGSPRSGDGAVDDFG